ncbi:hypothetical protein A2160_01655 [Candidatus Beckwithbacteria bacterium RBG_13_42_9]|uniref:Uncharacterized protein n=1 Tax=Candidatus Beckwithbacteria bacterium RBG_13_42_9 TaxID=1797457 RepID=A0A1F5E966_9BACT|nr:MAG: hypothetical protein A2160_01655 [Candidatus Beckwithbacteria bacterium RBG_13_42_9]
MGWKENGLRGTMGIIFAKEDGVQVQVALDREGLTSAMEQLTEQLPWAKPKDPTLGRSTFDYATEVMTTISQRATSCRTILTDNLEAMGMPADMDQGTIFRKLQAIYQEAARRGSRSVQALVHETANCLQTLNRISQTEITSRQLPALVLDPAEQYVDVNARTLEVARGAFFALPGTGSVRMGSLAPHVVELDEMPSTVRLAPSLLGVTSQTDIFPFTEGITADAIVLTSVNGVLAVDLAKSAIRGGDQQINAFVKSAAASAISLTLGMTAAELSRLFGGGSSDNFTNLAGLLVLDQANGLRMATALVNSRVSGALLVYPGIIVHSFQFKGIDVASELNEAISRITSGTIALSIFGPQVAGELAILQQQELIAKAASGGYYAIQNNVPALGTPGNGKPPTGLEISPIMAPLLGAQRK